MNPTTTWYLVLAAVLFGVGAFGLMVRRNPLVMFMCIELMLNAANLTFVAFATSLADINGQTAVFFVMVVAAAERAGEAVTGFAAGQVSANSVLNSVSSAGAIVATGSGVAVAVGVGVGAGSSPHAESASAGSSIKER